MFTRKQMEKYADVLIWGLDVSRPAPLARHDIVLVQYDLAAVGLAEALFSRLARRGIHAIVRAALSSRMELDFYALGDDEQISFQAPGQRELYETLNGAIYLLAPQSLTHLSAVDPKRIAQAAVARKPLRDILVAREEKGLYSWTLCVYPTEELASCAGLSKREYASQIAKACMLGASDPVKAWRGIFESAKEIKKSLNSLQVENFHVESEHTDLVITPGASRKWVGISGHNIPSFELFLSPDWRGTSGVYYADQPSYRNGNLVRGVKLTFEQGRAVAATADEGEDFVNKQLLMDEGANKLGEFSLTDKRFSRIDKFMANTLFDENFGGSYGNCHVALGSSYSDTYDGDPSTLTPKTKEELGFNDSALHWDLVNTENKKVTAKLKTGQKVTIYENGCFIY